MFVPFKCLKKLQKCFLRQIFGITMISDTQQTILIDFRVMFQYKLIHGLFIPFFNFSVLTENPHPFSFPPRIVSIKYNSDSCRKDSLIIYIFLNILPDKDSGFSSLQPLLFQHICNATVHCEFL